MGEVNVVAHAVKPTDDGTIEADGLEDDVALIVFPQSTPAHRGRDDGPARGAPPDVRAGGIGAYTSLLILAEVGDFSRFPTGDRLAAYAGLVPSQHQSGDTAGHGSITKEGNPILRWALVEAARNHVRLCPESSVSQRFVRFAATKGHGKAMIATARQLCTVLKSMTARGNRSKSIRELEESYAGWVSAFRWVCGLTGRIVALYNSGAES